MTTTPECKAPEQVVTDALVMTDLSDYAGTDMGMINQAVGSVIAALHAAGLLVSDPTENACDPEKAVILGGGMPVVAPSPDREKLVANAEDWLRNGSPLGPRRIIRSLIDALAAQPVLDERNVAEVIEQMRDRSRKERDVAKESLGQFIARALCEAAKRGELSLK